MKAGVVGVGNIGIYHVRELLSLNCEIVGVLCKNKDKSSALSERLSSLSKIKIPIFYNENDFFNLNMDVLFIATPPESHSDFIKKGISKGVHIFCEKPLVFDSLSNNYSSSKELFSEANKKEILIQPNTQWAVLTKYIPFQNKKINNFEMLMEPGVKGVDMLKEMIPHMNSVLIKLIPSGNFSNIAFITKSSEHIELTFIYSNKDTNCRCKYILNYNPQRPRAINIKINDLIISRKVDAKYNQSLCFSDKEIKIEDPFKTSISSFITAVKNKNPQELLVSEKEALDNILLQDAILKSF